MSRHTQPSIWGARRNALVRELAVETIGDPAASEVDRAHAREQLLSRDLDVERLTETELDLLEQLLAKCEGRATSVALPTGQLAPSVDPIGFVPDAGPTSACCSRCERFSDDDLAELDAALAAD